MPRNIEIVSYDLTFFKGEETKVLSFSTYVDRDVYDDPKEAIIDHISDKITLIQGDANIPGFLPKFKTLRIWRSHKPSDLDLK